VPEVGRAVRGRLASTDLAAAAATLTYFAGIAVVPWLLLLTWTTTWFSSADAVERRLRRMSVLVPPDMGARAPYDLLVHAGTHLSPLAALVLLFPGSFYGEGLRRACLEVVPHEDHFTGWRARLLVLPVLVLLPAVGAVWIAVGGALVPLAPEGGGGGIGDLLVRIVVGFVTLWLSLTLPLAWLYHHVAPRPLGWVAALLGGLGVASFLAGFLEGFWLFLSIPIDLGSPFGGLGGVGGVVAVGLWLYVLHSVVLVGWVVVAEAASRWKAAA
jgi:membrane protein